MRSLAVNHGAEHVVEVVEGGLIPCRAQPDFDFLRRAAAAADIEPLTSQQKTVAWAAHGGSFHQAAYSAARFKAGRPVVCEA